MWWEGFRKCHPEVTQHMPSSLSAASSNVMKDSIQEWFAAARRYIEEIDGGPQVLRDLRHVFNCDKSGFPLDSNTGRIKAVLAEKGARHVMKRERGTKTQITILGCANAAGDFMSPYLVYPGQLMTVCMGYENFPEAIYTQTENGWMDADFLFRVHLLFRCLGKEVEDCTSSYPVGRWTHVSPRSTNGQILCVWTESSYLYYLGMQHL